GLDPVPPGSQEIAELRRQILQGALPLRPGQIISSPRRELREVLGMRPPRCVGEPRALPEALRSVIPDRFEHDQARPLAVQAANETLVDQGREPIHDADISERPEPARYLLDRLDSRGKKQRQKFKERSLLVVEQLIAPVDGAGRGLLALC